MQTTDTWTHAEAHRSDNPDLDWYAQKGVFLSRDAAHLVLANLAHAVYDLETRPCEANDTAAEQIRELRRNISAALR